MLATSGQLQRPLGVCAPSDVVRMVDLRDHLLSELPIEGGVVDPLGLQDGVREQSRIPGRRLTEAALSVRA
jgi:hypothetical protein